MFASHLGDRQFTSGVLTTYCIFSQAYGYFEMRARLPAGKGLWPAFWLLPTDQSWPPEIDIMEVLDDNPRKLYGTVHYKSTKIQARIVAAVPDTSQGFHSYGVRILSHGILIISGLVSYRRPTTCATSRCLCCSISLSAAPGPGHRRQAPNFLRRCASPMFARMLYRRTPRASSHLLQPARPTSKRTTAPCV